MKITLENIGKKFNREWIFRNVSHEFSDPGAYAILGTNGCGKSTLLQIIAGSSSQSEGTITLGGPKADDQNTFRDLTLAAPYLELPEEMTWSEVIKFHGKFKTYLNGYSEEKILELSGLAAASDKEIRNFSSGMKQRARLTLAILSDTPLLLLDEPSTNLDANAVKWYQNLISEYTKERLVIVCSNYNKEEYSFCTKEFVLKSPA